MAHIERDAALLRALDFARPAPLMPLAFPSAKAPAPPAVTPMPDPNDPAVLAAKNQAMAAAASRSGSLSTILTGQSAAPNYTSSTLGAA